MAAIQALASAYDDDGDSAGNESPEEEITPDHTAHLEAAVTISQLKSKIQLNCAPTVTAKVCSLIVNYYPRCKYTVFSYDLQDRKVLCVLVKFHTVLEVPKCESVYRWMYVIVCMLIAENVLVSSSAYVLLCQ